MTNLDLDIILRTCTRVHAISGRPRLAGLTKPEIARRSTFSLVRAVRIALDAGCIVRTIVVDDGSGNDFLQWLASCAAKQRVSVVVVSLAESGHYGSFTAATTAAERSSGKLIYFVEDDYIHYPEAVTSMLDAYGRLASVSVGGRATLHPYDCPDRYRGTVYPATIHAVNQQYWRSVRHTTATLLLHRETFKEHRKEFERFARYGKDPTICEDTTINRIHTSVLCYAPIPTLAVHLQYEDTIPIMMRLGGWRGIWNASDPA